MDNTEVKSIHQITVNTMAKKPKNESTGDENLTEVENQANKNHDLENNQNIDVVENSAEQPVVVKKSSGGLSLLISLLALAGVVYLFYQDWLNNSQTTNNGVSPAVIQQLQDSAQVLSADLQNVQVDINGIKQQSSQITAVEQQLKQLSEQLDTLENVAQNTQQGSNLTDTDNQFDNSANELALARLQQQLTDQAQTIGVLQSKPSAIGSPSSSGQTDNLAHIEKSAAIQVLLTTDVLLSTHRIPQALAALDNYLKVSSLKTTDKNKILRLLNQLQQIEQPDLEQIDQQLQALKTTVHALQVSTETNDSDETKWYERFVSVKKIETESNISSTAQMVTFKTELNRLLYQAKLYLMLSDQVGWQSSLNAAAKWVKDEMPENKALSSRITALADQAIVADIPKQLDVAAVIDELSGLR